VAPPRSAPSLDARRSPASAPAVRAPRTTTAASRDAGSAGVRFRGSTQTSSSRASARAGRRFAPIGSRTSRGGTSPGRSRRLRVRPRSNPLLLNAGRSQPPGPRFALRAHQLRHRAERVRRERDSAEPRKRRYRPAGEAALDVLRVRPRSSLLPQCPAPFTGVRATADAGEEATARSAAGLDLRRLAECLQLGRADEPRRRGPLVVAVGRVGRVGVLLPLEVRAPVHWLCFTTTRRCVAWIEENVNSRRISVGATGRVASDGNAFAALAYTRL
jgi:hypothetical protein